MIKSLILYIHRTIIVMKHIPNTNSILFGPVAFIGTAAPLMTVNAGVRSCTLALAAKRKTH